MFDIGFFEIVFVFVIALIVIGPERLPRVARTAGLWIGKMRGFVASVKADIDRELATEELQKALQKQAVLPELEELVDEVTGKPLKAGERIASRSGAVDDDSPAAAEEDGEDRQK